MIRGSRRTQPYRAQTPRAPGPALSAMMAGKASYGGNPAAANRSRARRARKPRALRY